MKKRILSFFLSAAMALTLTPPAFAASDIDGHWAEKYIKYLNAEGVINPSASSGDYNPSAKVTRAEFMRYLNRAFHFEETANISYSDVPSTAWYYETIQIATKYGYIAGVGENKMDPLGYVTREQAATIIGRLYKVNAENSNEPLSFSDRSKISSWSKGYIADAVDKGYIVGYSDGTFQPQNTVTRAEVARILYSYLGTSLSHNNGVYTSADFRSDVDNVTISEPGTLTGATVKGDVYITEGLGSDTVTLSDVTIEGNLIVSGGSVTLSGVSVENMIVGTPMNRLVQVTASNETNVALTEVQSTASLYERGLLVSAGGFSDIRVNGNENTVLTVDAEIWDFDLESKSNVTLAADAVVNQLTMGAAGRVAGYGTVRKAIMKATDADLDMQPESYEVADGVTATVNGKTVRSDMDVSFEPASLTVDKGSSTLNNSYDFRISKDSGTLDNAVCEGKLLEEGSDFRMTESGVRLYRTFLTELSEGTHSVELVFANGARGRITVRVNDTTRNTLDTMQATFDRYPESDNYRDIKFQLSQASGSQINSVRLSGSTLVRGEDYTYNSTTGEVTLARSSLAKRSTGNITVAFSMSRGNNLTARITIVDTRPVNALSLSKVDFDANKSSSSYGDINLTLTTVDGAKLQYIHAVEDNKDLEADWQYSINGDKVSLLRSAIASMATKGRTSITLRFVMSKGISPELQINFVTTFAVTVNVADDLGNPIEGASVIIRPQENFDTSEPAPSAEQEQSTDSVGVATFQVKNGLYTITVQGDKFDTITKPVQVRSSTQKITVNPVIEEEIEVCVTDSLGAKVSGATVTLGNKSVTTGADGMALFSIGHGNYTLRVVAPGHATYTQSYQVSKPDSFRVKLS